jgi:rhodanese-related sulfurtransferase
MAGFVEGDEVEEAVGDLEARIINVLPREEFDERHIPHSINIPLDEPGFEETVRRFVPRLDQRVVVHCSGLSSPCSSEAARRLEAMGYTQVYDYKAGMEGWAIENRPIEAGQASQRTDPPERPARPRPEGTRPQQVKGSA